MDRITAMTVDEAYAASYRGEEWFVHMKFVGGSSDKFWEAWGVGRQGAVYIRYGRNGSEGTTIIKNFTYFGEKKSEKLSKGYKLHTTGVTRPRSVPAPAFSPAPAPMPAAIVAKLEPKPKPEPRPESDSKQSLQSMMALRKKRSEW